jgi:hypothetical protein
LKHWINQSGNVTLVRFGHRTLPRTLGNKNNAHDPSSTTAHASCNHVECNISHDTREQSVFTTTTTFRCRHRRTAGEDRRTLLLRSSAFHVQWGDQTEATHHGALPSSTVVQTIQISEWRTDWRWRQVGSYSGRKQTQHTTQQCGTDTIHSTSYHNTHHSRHSQTDSQQQQQQQQS